MGIDGLLDRGALPWPDPETAEALVEVLDPRPPPAAIPMPEQGTLPLGFGDAPPDGDRPPEPAATHADELFAEVRELLRYMDAPMSERDAAAALGVSSVQARKWLTRLVDEGISEKLPDPVRYRPAGPTVSSQIRQPGRYDEIEAIGRAISEAAPDSPGETS